MSSATENRFINLYINGKQAGSTLNEIRGKYRKLSAEINRGELSQKEYNAKVKELRQYGKILDDHRQKLRGVNKSWSMLKGVAAGVIGGNIILSAFQKITQFIPNLIQQNAKLADSFADVQKTTNLTDAGIEDLNRRLKSIDTRTPRARLLELARDAGKLGIQGAENISGFVRAADQINVSLGEDLGEDAIKQLGKLNNIFKISDTYGYEQGLLKIGSVINELGANSEASEGNITDFITRLAGVADQADINIQAIAGFGAELDKLGQRTETSATAVSQAIVGMFRDTPTYAKIAGKSVEEFTETLNTDANEAFIQFLEGLNGNNEGLTELSTKFDQLGIDGSRAITVLGALSANTEDLRKQQGLANQAFAEGTSLTEEFARKNENAAANIEKIGRYINSLWVNSSLKSAIDAVTSSLADMVKVPVSENIEDQRIRFNALIGVLQDVNTTEDVRRQVIQQINESYGERLGNMDLEKASLEDLARLQASVNQQYLIEIALQRQKERFQEIAEEQAKNLERRTKTSINSQELLARANERLGTSYTSIKEAVAALQEETKDARRMGAITPKVQEYNNLSSAIGDLNSVTVEQNQLSQELADQQTEQANILDQLKKDYPELAQVIDQTYAKINGLGTTETNDQGPREGDKKFIQGRSATYSGGKWVFDPIVEPTSTDPTSSGMTPSGEKADPLAIIKQQREEEMLYLEQHRAQELIDEEQFQQEMIGIKITYLLMEKQAKLAAGQDVTSTERSLAQAQIELMEMVNRAREKSAAVAEKAADVTSDAAQRQKEAQEAAAIAAVESASMRAASAVEGAKTEYDAAVAVINVIRDTIKEYVIQAIVGAVAKEVASKGLLGVALGAVAAGLASALFDTLIPPVTVPKKPEFATGTGFFGGEAIVGDQGRELVQLPLGSQVTPADITQQILAANAFSRPTPQPNFSLINDGLTYTQSQQVKQGAISDSTPGTPDNSGLIAEIRAMREDLRRAQSKPVNFVYTDYRKFKEEVNSAEGQVVFRK